LGVHYQRIRVVHGQTDQISYGMGAFASRVTVMTGEAARLAALKVRAKALDVAAELLQTSSETLDIVNGKVIRLDVGSGTSVALGDVARHLSPASKSLGDRSPGLTDDGWFHTDQMNYPYGVHAAVVRVDGDTGAVKVLRYLVAFDIGKAVNPMLVQGQLAG